MLRKIVVTGPCAFEAEGVMAQLLQSGYLVCEGRTMKAGSGDMVVVVLSAQPEPGFWRYTEMLRAIRREGNYRMVALVPGSLERVLKRQGICAVVPGDADPVWGMLLAEIREWLDGRPEKKEEMIRGLTEGQVRALTGVLTGHEVGRRGEYSYRYRGLARLGFKNVQQYQRYFAGMLGEGIHL